MAKIKKIGKIYSEIYDFENLYQSYLLARKNKRYRKDVLEFTKNLEENLIILQNELIWKSYKINDYKEFYIYKPKKRLIFTLPFRDRVVQWAIYRKVNPYFEKQYIRHSYACIKGRGTHAAVKRVQYWLKKIYRSNKQYYCLKMDIAKYFYRIDRSILENILSKTIKDKELLGLLKIIINKANIPFGLEINCNKEIRIFEKGIPIGNLTSQMFANIYLNELDQYVKRILRVKYYIRYMDDFLILHEDKKYLHYLKETIEMFLEKKLKLQLNNKTSIKPIKLGIDFLGYKIWGTHIKLRKSTALRIRRHLKHLSKKYSKNEESFEKINSTVQSYIGLMEHCNSYSLRKKIFVNFILKKSN